MKPSQFFVFILSLGLFGFFNSVPAFPDTTGNSSLELVMRDMGLSKTPTQLSTQREEKFYDPVIHRKFAKLILTGNNIEQINITVSFPDSYKNGHLPVIFILPGLGYGQEVVKLIENPGNNIVVGYEYPFDFSRLPSNTGDFYKGLQKAPAQIASVLSWTAAQPWADPKRVNTLAISMGTFLLPLSQRMTDMQGTSIYCTVLAYGGANLTEFIAEAFKNRVADKDLNTFIQLLKFVILPYAPETHLPYLKGHFLVIAGSQDEVIPLNSRKALEELTPQPKDLVVINGPHIGENRPEIIGQAKRAVQDWLQSMGAVNP